MVQLLITIIFYNNEEGICIVQFLSWIDLYQMFCFLNPLSALGTYLERRQVTIRLCIYSR